MEWKNYTGSILFVTQEQKCIEYYFTHNAMYNGTEILSQRELDDGMIEVIWASGWIYIVYPEELNV